MPILRGTAKDFEPLLAKKRENSVPNVAENTERAPRQRKPKELLPENQVEAQVIGFLEVQGWRCQKQHVGVFRRKGTDHDFAVGKKGDLDWLCLRPAFPHAVPRRTECQVLFLEVKAFSKEPSQKQLIRIAELTALGFLATWTDSLEKFWNFYEKRIGRAA